jgi:hypothetical protein
LRVDQPAIVTLVDRPNIAFDATLCAIDETPVDSPNGALYRITFSVMNAEREQLAGIPVRVRLAQMLPRIDGSGGSMSAVAFRRRPRESEPLMLQIGNPHRSPKFFLSIFVFLKQAKMD